MDHVRYIFTLLTNYKTIEKDHGSFLPHIMLLN